jgi:HK97 family phage major capsid protein
MRFSLKQIDEEREALGAHVKAILNRARAENRDITESEKHEFDKGIVRLRELKLDGELAETERRNIIANSGNRQGQNMSGHPSGTVYNQMQYNGPERVLPVNGILPDGQQRRYQPYNRIGKLKAFRDEQMAYDAGMWYRAVIAREINHAIDNRAEDYCKIVGLEITNTGYEGSGPAGGYLVPAPISSAIIEVREKVGISRQVCNVLPTSSDTLTVPKKTGGLTVYIVGETLDITASDKSWGSVACTLKKRACLSYISQELSEDSLINLVDNIVSEQAYALALQEDDELVNGTGGSAYGDIQGLLSSIGSAGVSTAAASSTWAAVTMAELMAAVGLLPDRYFAYGPAWICSHSFFNSVMVRLAFAAGGATASEVMAGTPNVRSFAGYPVYLTSKMPTATAVSTKSALFGAFNQAVILADRGGIRVQRSDDIKFVEDLIALKAVSRYDMNVHDPGTSSAAGAYVAFSTHS